jgi:hypothetical protein
VLDQYRFEDVPAASVIMDDDNMYHCHVERLRTTAAFAKVFIYRHLFTIVRDEMIRLVLMVFSRIMTWPHNLPAWFMPRTF